MNTNKYNIFEAYLYRFKKFILVFSYTPGFDINFIIEDIQQTFNLRVIKLDGNSYLRADSVFNYDKLNTDVNNLLEKKEVSLTTITYGTAILIHGLAFPTNLLKFQIDIHLHFALSATLFLKTIEDATLQEYNNFKILLEDNIIHKYFNIKSDKSIDINNSVFDKIIDYLEFKVYGEKYTEYSTKIKKENKLNPQPIKENIQESIETTTDKSKKKYSDDEIDSITTDVLISTVENEYDKNDPNIEIMTDSPLDILSDDSNLDTDD